MDKSNWMNVVMKTAVSGLDISETGLDANMILNAVNEENVGNQNETLSVDEEYNLWRSNVPLMYDFVSETELVWPSLTIQWLPHGKGPISRNIQQMILGTHTSGEEPNYLKIAAITLPDEVVDSDEDDTDGMSIDRNDQVYENDNSKDKEDYVQSNIRIMQKFQHEEEVNRARYMPQNPNIIATINGLGLVSIFDRDSDQCKAIKTLKYHKDNGYGLSFNPNWEGYLLSGSDDHTIALWDLNKDAKPVHIWGEGIHKDIVNDCKWNEFNKNIFGSVSEDLTLKIHDLRSNDRHNFDSSISFSSECVFNTIAFSKHSEYLFGAAGTDSYVHLFDMRKIQEPLHSMSGHQDAVTNLEFFEHKDGILMSSGSDRRAIIWDINEIGKEQVFDDAEDASPEVVMIHGGHKSPVNDMSINSNIPWLMATCEENNIVQVWKGSKRLPTIGGLPKLNETLYRELLDN